MKKYLRIALSIFRLSWMRQMEYRVNFITWLVIDFLWTLLDIVFFAALVRATQTLGNWGFGEGLVVIGVFRLLGVPVWGWFYTSFSMFTELMNKGNLDLFLTRPVSSQFMVSVQRFSPSLLSSVVGGMAFVILGLRELGRVPSLAEFLLFVWLYVIAVVLIYAVYFLIMTAALFSERINNLHHVFTAFFDAVRFPREVFHPVVQRIFSTIFPVSLMLIIPVDVFFGNVLFVRIIWLHVVTIAFFLVGHMVWNIGLRRYSSASS